MKNTADQTTRQIGLRFFSNATVYAVGTALIKVGALLVIPIYWLVLKPEDFGLISISQIIIQFLASFLDLGISGSIQRHYFEWKKNERPHHLSALWVFSLSFSFIVCLALSLLSPFATLLFETDRSQELIFFGIWIAFFQNFGLLPFALTRIKEQLPLFSILTFSQFIAQTTCVLIFIFPLKMGYQGYLYGTLVGAMVYAVASLFYISRQIRFPFTWQHLKEPLSYALPTAPAGILEGLGTIIDRFFLQRFIGMGELGIYSLARQFGGAYNFFVSTLKSSWVPLVYRMVFERADASKILSRLSTYYLYILMISALAVSTLAQQVVLWIGKEDFFGVIPYIPFFVLVYVFYGVGNIYGRGLDLAKKTQYYWLVYAVNFGVNLSCLWWLTPRFGIWGAIASLLIAGVCREATLIGLAVFFYPRPVDGSSILKISLTTLIVFFITQTIHIESLWLLSALKILIIVMTALGIAMWVFGRHGFKTAQAYVKRKLKI